MHKIKKRGLLVGVILATVFLIYIIGIVYFNSHFYPGIKAGPVNIGQLSVAAAQDEINKQLNEENLLFTEAGQEVGHLESSQLQVQVPFEETLNQELEKQNSLLWPFQIFYMNPTFNIRDHIEMNPEEIEKLISNLGVNNESRQATVNAQLVKNEDNFYDVVEEIQGNQVDINSMEAALTQTLVSGLDQVQLENAYIKPTVTANSEAMTAKQNLVEKMIGTQITLTFDGNEITIPAEEIRQWIYMDENNQPQVNIESVEEYIYGLNEQYSSLFLPRSFESTYQGTVQVQDGTFGWYIDRYEEAPIIAEAIINRENLTRTPIIAGTGYGLEDEVGGSYVEIDLTYQMMFIYLDHQLVLETPIVSGIIGAETIPGAYQVWNMEKDTDLVGYNVITQKDYVQPVSYWIAFDNQAQGIHDANWQSYFGGDAYMTAGSLGCINTPPAVMGQVFDLVYYGMPVLIFH